MSRDLLDMSRDLFDMQFTTETYLYRQFRDKIRNRPNEDVGKRKLGSVCSSHWGRNAAIKYSTTPKRQEPIFTQKSISVNESPINLYLEEYFSEC